MDELVKRINELAKKQREEGLTVEEKEEQKQLRQKYLVRFRASFSNQLKNTYVMTETGKVPLSEYNKRHGKD